MSALLVAAVLAFVPSARFPGVLVRGGFVMPSGNIACNVGPLGQKKTSALGIGCAVYSTTNARGIGTWWMHTTGPARTGHVKSNAATDYPKLAYGRTYRWHGITCRSARTGLTCRNRSGHGFFLSRERQRTF